MLEEECCNTEINFFHFKIIFNFRGAISPDFACMKFLWLIALLLWGGWDVWLPSN